MFGERERETGWEEREIKSLDFILNISSIL